MVVKEEFTFHKRRAASLNRILCRKSFCISIKKRTSEKEYLCTYIYI